MVAATPAKAMPTAAMDGEQQRRRPAGVDGRGQDDPGHEPGSHHVHPHREEEGRRQRGVAADGPGQGELRASVQFLGAGVPGDGGHRHERRAEHEVRAVEAGEEAGDGDVVETVAGAADEGGDRGGGHLRHALEGLFVEHRPQFDDDVGGHERHAQHPQRGPHSVAAQQETQDLAGAGEGAHRCSPVL